MVYVQGRQVVQLQAGRLVQQWALLQVQEELELGFFFRDLVRCFELEGSRDELVS